MSSLVSSALTVTTTSTVTSSNNNINNKRQLVRAIQACQANVHQALKLLGDSNEEGPILAALHVCGSAHDHVVAIQLYQRLPDSESIRALAIAVCGKSGQHRKALELLQTIITTTTTRHHHHHHEEKKKKIKTTRLMSLSSIASYHAAIAACGHAQAWKDALSVLRMVPVELLSTFTYNACLTALVTSKRGMEAKELLKEMKQSKNKNCQPDRSTFHQVVMALVKCGRLDHAHAIFLEMKQSPDTFPKDATYEILITAYGKRKKWEMAHTLETERQDGIITPTSQKKKDDDEPVYYFQHWTMNQLCKVGRGKYARWEFGWYRKDYVIAVHPHKNAAKNGISILLVQQGKKVGHLLMVNKDNTSTLLGVYVDPKQRKSGLSKVFLGLWCKFCLEANIEPRTGIINKPLLALVLQCTFGFLPQQGMGVDAELSRGDKDTIVLYSPTHKNLEGAFSPKDVKGEGLVIAKKPTDPRGRQVRVGSTFHPPEDSVVFKGRIDNALGEGSVSHELTSHDLRRLFLGEK